ncbi:MAG TPA: hypothetical protein VK590_03185 [Saprospiraceae bacterium]|nr:hypothetical protein [Saprospiraceae bacterium]
MKRWFRPVKAWKPKKMSLYKYKMDEEVIFKNKIGDSVFGIVWAYSIRQVYTEDIQYLIRYGNGKEIWLPYGEFRTAADTDLLFKEIL